MGAHHRRVQRLRRGGGGGLWRGGRTLLLGARRVDRLKVAAGQAVRAGAPAAHFHALDVTQTASVEAFVQWARDLIQVRHAKAGKLHVLINNAGGAHGLDTVAEVRTRIGKRCCNPMCSGFCA